MPELPEVEALRRGLVKKIIGSRILKVEIRNQKLVAGKGTTRKPSKKKTEEFISNLKNKKIVAIERRAKNLIFKLDTGEIILVHLKMTGQLVFKPEQTPTNSPLAGGEKMLTNTSSAKESLNGVVLGGHPIEESELKLPHKHTYIIFILDNGTLFYNDVRQFGYVLYFANEKILEEEKHFEKIGIEPFDKNFTAKYFKDKIKEISKKRNPPIKKVLLDQEIVVGCGNIYCDEVLWASSVLPTRGIKSLKDLEIEKIYKNIKIILDKAINSGGSSVANYLLADGKRGNYADYHKVYQKEGERCQFTTPTNSPLKRGRTQCTGIIEKITFAGRGTHFCPVHQH